MSGDDVMRDQINKSLNATLKRWLRDTSGSIAIIAAFALPVALMASSGVIDMLNAIQQRSVLQHAVDAGAMAAARELSLADGKRDNVSSVVESHVKALVSAQYDQSASAPKLMIQTKYDEKSLEVSVWAEHKFKSSFGPNLGLTVDKIAAGAAAQIVGRPNICILGLDAREAKTIYLDSNASVIGSNCAIFSNSRSSRSITALSNALLKGSSVCSAGGVDTEPKNISPAPQLDCPQFEDPLAGRVEPSVGPCDYKNKQVVDAHRTLSPGVYCGGLVIDGNSEIELSEGVYVIKGGEFRVDSNSRVSGTGVGIYLSGRDARFVFASNAVVELKAPTSGPMAGLLFFSDRTQSGDVRNEIFSNYARVLVGTIYLPKAELVIDSDQSVADQSEYTAIVVNRFVATSGPKIVLNTNYDQTDVPVPEGIKGAGQPVRLIQ